MHLGTLPGPGRLPLLLVDEMELRRKSEVRDGVASFPPRPPAATASTQRRNHDNGPAENHPEQRGPPERPEQSQEAQ